MNEPNSTAVANDKKRVAAGTFAILFGWLGLHKFYLGYTVEGIIVFVLLLISQGNLGPMLIVVGIVESILYLTRSDEEFKATYITGKKSWF